MDVYFYVQLHSGSTDQTPKSEDDSEMINQNVEMAIETKNVEPQTICFRPGTLQNAVEVTDRYRKKATGRTILLNAECDTNFEGQSRTTQLILLCADGKQHHNISFDLPCQCPTTEQLTALRSDDEVSSVVKSTNDYNQLMCANYSPDNLDAAVRLLVYQKNDPSEYKSWGSLLILSRIYWRNNLFEIVRHLFEVDGIDVNAKNKDNWNALHIFSTSQHGRIENLIDIVRLLIEKGIDVNAKTKNNMNALHYLCQTYVGDNLIEIFRLLIDSGIDVNATTRNHWNALQLACRYYKGRNLIDIVRLFIDSGIDVNSKTNDNWNALHFAFHYYSGDKLIEIVEFLIEKGIDLNATTNDDWNALHFLCHSYKGDYLIEFIRLLIDKGIDVNARMSNGDKATDSLRKRGFTNSSPEVKLLYLARRTHND